MQTTVLFTLPPTIDAVPLRSAADWRAQWVDAGIGTYDDWNRIRVSAVRGLLWVVAGDPVASAWISARLDGLAGVVAATLGTAVSLEVRDRSVGVRASTDELWAYRLPRWVVDKSAGDWQPHFATPLSDALQHTLARRIEAGIRRELAMWGRLPPELPTDQSFLVLSDPGRAVPIPAIGATRSGHGKGVTVLARSQVCVLSYWRFEGHLAIGPLASLGFGRLLRGSAPELLSPALQRALLTIQPDSLEIT